MSIITVDPNKLYVHYGSKSFDKDKVKRISNEDYFLNKPRGGFWGSPVDTDWGWKDWCESNEYGNLSSHFYFSLKPGTKILQIKDPGDERIIPTMRLKIGSDPFAEWIIQSDFASLPSFGISGIELIHGDNWSYWHDGDWCADFNNYPEHSRFNSWDCDSIVIFDSSVVIDLGGEYERRDRVPENRGRRAG